MRLGSASRKPTVQLTQEGDDEAILGHAETVGEEGCCQLMVGHTPA